MSETQPPYDGPLTLLDYWEILRLPMLLALIAIAGTWAVWYLTSETCSPELAQITGCNPGQVAQYINIDALNKMVAHAVVGGGGGGLWSFAMITRERRAREEERRAREAAERQLAEERQRADEERHRNDEERQRADEERQRADEERQRADEERSRLLARIAELEARQNGHGSANS